MEKLLLSLVFIFTTVLLSAQTVLIQMRLDNSAGVGKPKKWQWDVKVYDGGVVDDLGSFNTITEFEQMHLAILAKMDEYYEEGYRVVTATDNTYLLQKK